MFTKKKDQKYNHNSYESFDLFVIAKILRDFDFITFVRIKNPCITNFIWMTDVMRYS